MTDLQGFFQRFRRRRSFRAESQVPGLVRQEGETVVGKDRMDPFEFGKDVEGHFVGGKFQMQYAFFIPADPGGYVRLRQIIGLVFGKETLVGAENRAS